MKKLIVLLIPFLMVGCAGALKLPDVNAVKLETHVGEKMEQVVKVDDVTGIKKADVKATAVDLSKKKTETIGDVGGSVIKRNDSEMIMFIFGKVMDNMKYIFGALFGFLLSLMGGVWMILKFQANAYNKTIDSLIDMIEKDEIREDKLEYEKIMKGGKK